MAHEENQGNLHHDDESRPALRILSPELLNVPALDVQVPNDPEMPLPTLGVRQRVWVPIAKIIMIGDAGVGKTCMMQRFSSGEFRQDANTTVGVEFAAKTIAQDGRDAAYAQVWDTAGQERFRSLPRGYYRGSHVCLLMFDISRRDSFSSLPRHIAECRAHAHPAIVTCVVACKGDLAHIRQVSHEEIQHFCQEAGVHGYCEASALTGEGVDEVYRVVTLAAVTRFPVRPPEADPTAPRSLPERFWDRFCGCLMSTVMSIRSSGICSDALLRVR